MDSSPFFRRQIASPKQPHSVPSGGQAPKGAPQDAPQQPKQSTPEPANTPQPKQTPKQTPSGTGCTNPRQRREFRELSETERQAFITATLCMRDRRRAPPRLGARGSTTLYDDYVYAHAQARSVAHGQPAFLPWHRRFLASYERDLQNVCGYTGTLPYWDWAYDSQAPETSEILTDKYFGGDGVDSNRNCLSGGPFRNWTVTLPRADGCLRRNYRNNGRIAAWLADVELEAMFSARPAVYDTFREAVERPHGDVHVGIGGHMSGVDTSANDPLFYLHHANIDRLWDRWQRENPAAGRTYGGSDRTRSGVRSASLSDQMDMFGIYSNAPVRDMLSTTSGGIMCYTYSNSILPRSTLGGGVGDDEDDNDRRRSLALRRRNLAADFNKFVESQEASADTPLTRRAPTGGYQGSPENPITPGPYDRDDQYNLRYHEPIPDSYLRDQMHYTDERIAKFRKMEDYYSRFVDYVNAAAGFVSTQTLKYITDGKGYKSCTDEELARVRSLRKMVVEACNAAIGYFDFSYEDVVVAVDSAKDAVEAAKQWWEQRSAGARPVAYSWY
ncbi:hypothetical protein DFS34DRAFT_580698 [Phlyctochytrium arcticum]|nr:hypothetical protein DFS34DRAFT_580698 [Phlyctochytrium arcticum]